MDFLIETPRLYLRRFIPEDESIFLEIEADERLTKYIHKRSAEESRALFSYILESYTREDGLGRWGLFDPVTDDFIGVGLLAPSLYDPSYIELGYRLHQQYWGRGLASEMAKALVRYGLHTLQLKEIVAVIDPENKASEKVLLNSGFTRYGEVFWYDEMLPFFKVTR